MHLVMTECSLAPPTLNKVNEKMTHAQTVDTRPSIKEGLGVRLIVAPVRGAGTSSIHY